jgi:hypothetical protein
LTTWSSLAVLVGAALAGVVELVVIELALELLVAEQAPYQR